jgi:LCP family protein required for cell wall assembly
MLSRKAGQTAKAEEDDERRLSRAGDASEQPATTHQRRRTRRVLLLIVIVLMTMLGLLAGAVFVVSERLASQVHRYPNVFSGLEPDDRPPPTRALTFLFVGTDSLSEQPTTGTEAPLQGQLPGNARSDVIMLVQLNADRRGATVVSVPRDAWVPVPGRGRHKINAAFAFGGPSLLVQTVESLTNIRVDHFGVIDFAGFQAMTDAVGGIDVNVLKPTSFGALSFHAGLNHLDGEQALAYVRQRKGLPRGDLDRVQRQQNALRALLSRARSNGTLSDPLRSYELLNAITRWVSVDDTLTNSGLRTLAMDLRGLSGDNVTFLTAPVAGLGREGAQSVVYLDADRGAELWRAIKGGTVRDYLKKYPGDALPWSPS